MHHLHSPLPSPWLAALLALGASSCVVPEEQTLAAEEAEITILNKSNELHQLFFYAPRATLELDDQLADPATALSLQHFELERPAAIVSLFSGQEVGLGPSMSRHADEYAYGPIYEGDARIWLVRADALPPIIVRWGLRQPKQYYFDVDVPQEVPADQGTVVIEADYSGAQADDLHPWRYAPCDERQRWTCEPEQLEEAERVPAGARYSWRSVDEEALYRALPAPPLPQRCEVTPSGVLISWDLPVRGELEVDSARLGLDGCAAITGHVTGSAQAQTTWTLCAPLDMLELMQPGEDRVIIEPITPPLNAHSAIAFVIRRYTKEAGVQISARALTLARASASLPVAGLTARPEDLEGCAPTTRACSAELPLRFLVSGDGLEGSISAGQRLVLPTRGVTLYVASAGRRVMQDLGCALDPYTPVSWADLAMLEEVSP